VLPKAISQLKINNNIETVKHTNKIILERQLDTAHLYVFKRKTTNIKLNNNRYTSNTNKTH